MSLQVSSNSHKKVCMDPSPLKRDVVLAVPSLSSRDPEFGGRLIIEKSTPVPEGPSTHSLRTLVPKAI